MSVVHAKESESGGEEYRCIIVSLKIIKLEGGKKKAHVNEAETWVIITILPLCGDHRSIYCRNGTGKRQVEVDGLRFKQTAGNRQPRIASCRHVRSA